LRQTQFSMEFMQIFKLTLSLVLLLSNGSCADNLSCLTFVHPQAYVGCNSVRHRVQCLSSRDGRPAAEWRGVRIANEPCVWCGGIQCTNLGYALCEPRDFMLRGQALGVWRYGVPLSSLEYATCPTPTTAPRPPSLLTPTIVPNLTQLVTPDWKCLSRYVSQTNPDSGCNAITDHTTCITSRDGRASAEWMGIRISDQPCVWCGGGHCTDRGSALCEPADFMLRGQSLGLWTSGVPSELLEHAACPTPTSVRVIHRAPTKPAAQAPATLVTAAPTIVPTRDSARVIASAAPAALSGNSTTLAPAVVPAAGAAFNSPTLLSTALPLSTPMPDGSSVTWTGVGHGGSDKKGSAGGQSGSGDSSDVRNGTIRGGHGESDSWNGSGAGVGSTGHIFVGSTSRSSSSTSNPPNWALLFIVFLSVLLLIFLCIKSKAYPEMRKKRTVQTHAPELATSQSFEPLIAPPVLTTQVAPPAYRPQAGLAQRNVFTVLQGPPAPLIYTVPGPASVMPAPPVILNATVCTAQCGMPHMVVPESLAEPKMIPQPHTILQL